MAKKATNNKKVETLIHDEAKRKNIPTAEFQSVLQKEAQDQLKVTLPQGVVGYGGSCAARVTARVAARVNLGCEKKTVAVIKTPG